MFLGDKTALFRQLVLQIFQRCIVQISMLPADNAHQMIMMLTAVFTFKLLDPVTKIDLRPDPVVFDHLDRFIHVRPAEILLIPRMRKFIFHFALAALLADPENLQSVLLGEKALFFR